MKKISKKREEAKARLKARAAAFDKQ